MSQQPQGNWQVGEEGLTVVAVVAERHTPLFPGKVGGKGTGMDREMTRAKAAKQVTNLGSTQF